MILHSGNIHLEQCGIFVEIHTHSWRIVCPDIPRSSPALMHYRQTNYFFPFFVFFSGLGYGFPGVNCFGGSVMMIVLLSVHDQL